MLTIEDPSFYAIPAVGEYTIDSIVNVCGSGVVIGSNIVTVSPAPEIELGDDFDIKAFHAEILNTGSLPMPVLEAKIDRWIAGGGK